MIEDIQERQEKDAKRFEEHDKNLCMLCHAYGTDKRSLFVSCFYDVSEVVPEIIDLHGVEHLEAHDYYLRICKVCRAEFLQHLQEWRNERISLRDVTKNHDGYLLENDDEDSEAIIPMRVNGITVMMTPEQAEEYRASLREGK